MKRANLLTRAEWRAEGLSDEDVDGLIAFRSRHGPLRTQSFEEPIEGVTEEGRTTFRTVFNRSDTEEDDNALGPFELRLLPSPPSARPSQTLLTVFFNTKIDSELQAFQTPLSLRGPSTLKIWDVSPEHVIELRFDDANGEAFSAREAIPIVEQSTDLMDVAPQDRSTPEVEAESLTPTAERYYRDGPLEREGQDVRRENPVGQNPDDRSSADQSIWEVVPPLGPRESWSNGDRGIEASVVVETLSAFVAKPLVIREAKTITRNGRYQVLGQPNFRFDGYTFAVSYPAGSVLETLADITGNGIGPTSFRVSLNDPIVEKIRSALNFEQGQLDFEGIFSFGSLHRPGPEPKGWVWMLSGEELILGFEPDEKPFEPRSNIIITLPPDPVGSIRDDVPYNVTEKSLLDRADVFGSDPGVDCSPFDQPGRILGERRFFTALRVTQPKINATKSTALNIDLGAVRWVAESDENAFDIRGILLPDAPRIVPRLLPSHALQLAEQDKRRPINHPRPFADVDAPIEYEADDPGKNQARSVSIGHVLESAVRYRSAGYSLGDVAYSLTLAPRQTRRIVKMDYERRERSSRDESTFLDDATSDAVDSTRSYDNVVSASLDEWQRGRSKSKTSSAAAAAGFAVPGFVAGGGAVTSTSRSSSSQEGGRDTAARETQQLQDSIRRWGEATRSLQSTVVTETEQTETIEGVSEVIQNINYTRSLSVVYYEILRHMRIDTEIAGVSECIYVPLPVRKFDDDRIKKHSDVLRRYARTYWERLAFQYLDYLPRPDANGTQSKSLDNSDIPGGTRASQNLSSLSGSVFIRLGIEMPGEGEIADAVSEATERKLSDKQIAAIYYKSFRPFTSIVPVSISAIINRTIEASPAERNRYFQKEIAPHMARRNLNELRLAYTDEDDTVQFLDADFTMATQYSYGGVVRVDFTVDLGGESISRDRIKSLTVLFKKKSFAVDGAAPTPAEEAATDHVLPERSFMNVTSATIRYANSHYEDTAESDRGSRDLIDSTTGHTDPNGALLTFALSRADDRNFHRQIEDAYDDFKRRIQAKPFYYHKAIWWRMDRDELYTLLDGYSFEEAKGRSIASIVERRPAGIIGNCLVFRTATDRPLDPMFKTFEDLRNYYVDGLRPRDPIRLSLPTDGLYARAHMDGCVAAEEHNGSFDWVFDNNEPELADLPGSIFASRRAEPQSLAPSQMPDTLINLQNAPDRPAPSGLDGALSAVQNAGAFRDMAGLAGTQANALAGMQMATGLANSFGGMAHQGAMAELQAKATAGRNVKAATDAAQKAVAKGMMTEDAARAFVERVGGGGDTGKTAAHEVTDAATSVARQLSKGQTATISGVTSDGAFSTTIGSNESGEHVLKDDTAVPSDAFDFNVSEPVPTIAQPSDMTCWAAAVTILKGWEASDPAPSITDTINGLGFPFPEMLAADEGLSAARKPLLLERADLVVEPRGFANLMPEAYRDLLQEYGPIWVTVGKGTMGDLGLHASILTGVVSDGTIEGTQVRIIDPASGRRSEPAFAAFQARYEAVAADTAPEEDLFIQMVRFRKRLEGGRPGGRGGPARREALNALNTASQAASLRFSQGIRPGPELLPTNGELLHFAQPEGTKRENWGYEVVIDRSIRVLDLTYPIGREDVPAATFLVNPQHKHIASIVSELEWKEASVVVNGFADPIALPLSRDYAIAHRHDAAPLEMEAGHSEMFPLERRLERSVTVFFAWHVESDGTVSQVGLATNPIVTGRDFDGDIIYGLFELALCTPDEHFSPPAPYLGGPAKFARVFPLLSLRSARGATTLRATCVLKRPIKSYMKHGMIGDGRINAGLFTDRQKPRSLRDDTLPSYRVLLRQLPFPLSELTPEAFDKIVSIVPSPRWNSLFEHYSVGRPRTNLTVVDRVLTERFLPGIRRERRNPGEDWTTTDTRKVARQGEFDNVHLAPVMDYQGKDAFMAPLCEHDCLHMHWRWGESFEERFLQGFDGRRPYAKAGAPHVPENQTIRIDVNGCELTYRAEAHAPQAGDWQTFMHHGFGYVTSLNVAGHFSTAVEMADGLQNPLSDEGFYYHNRFWGDPSEDNVEHRLDESVFRKLETMDPDA